MRGRGGPGSASENASVRRALKDLPGGIDEWHRTHLSAIASKDIAMTRYHPTLLAVALAVAGGFCSLSATAQTETKVAQGSLAPPGEGPGTMSPASRTSGESTKSRAEVKARTKAANKAGELQPAGPAPLPEGVATRPGGNQAKNGPSSRSRSAVKAETKAQARAGDLVPAGEAERPIGQTQPK